MFIFLVFVLSRCALQCWLAQLVKNILRVVRFLAPYAHQLLQMLPLHNSHWWCTGYLEETDSCRTAALVVTVHTHLKNELS